jgi:hypothetical protein
MFNPRGQTSPSRQTNIVKTVRWFNMLSYARYRLGRCYVLLSTFKLPSVKMLTSYIIGFYVVVLVISMQNTNVPNPNIPTHIGDPSNCWCYKLSTVLFDNNMYIIPFGTVYLGKVRLWLFSWPQPLQIT